MNAKWIGADLLQTAPNEFFVLTEQDLNEYPAIRDAITNQGTGKVIMMNLCEPRIFSTKRAHML